jgi:GAF domain-containing protein
MWQKRLPQTGLSSSAPNATSARGTSIAGIRPSHVLSILARSTAPSLALGLVIAAALVVAETILGQLLSRVAPEDTLGVVYLLGVVVIAIGWGFWLAAATAAASALAFDFFLIEPIGSLTVIDPQDWVALTIFLVVALLASTLADLARGAATADRLRRDAELSGELGRMVAEQQAALRRVATLVARGIDPAEVFAAVPRELARVLGVQNASVWRYEPDGSATLLSAHDAPDAKKMPVGMRFTLEGDNVAAMVLHTGAPARMDSHDHAAGSAAAQIRELDLRGGVGAPIIVGGRLWGAAIVGTSRPEPLPPDTEVRVADFADLVATAIGNAATRTELEASHDDLRVLADLQAALRRVATLVARGTSSSEVFAAVAEEMARCLGTTDAEVFRYDPDGEAVVVVASYSAPGLRVPTVGERLTLEGDSVSARVLRTRRGARLDSYEDTDGTIAARSRELGLRSRVGAPIIVAGRLWGAAIVGTSRLEPLPSDTEVRVAHFADLVATAIANAATHTELEASRDDLRVLADLQAALRRVATLVAREGPPMEVFAAVTGELAWCLNAQHTTLFRYESDAEATLVATRHDDRSIEAAIGQRVSFRGENLARLVFDTGRAARMDSHDNVTGLAAAHIRQLGIRSAVGAPIVVGDRLWGAAIVGSSDPEPLAPDTEARVGDFAELVATAIANAATRDELQASRGSLAGLATQQSALRRVATLVARGASPAEVFSVVAEEMARCLNAGNAGVGRFDGDEVVVLATSQFDPDMKGVPDVGERIPLEGDNFVAKVLRTGAAARVDSSESQNVAGPIAGRVRELGLGCTVAVPIVVDGRVWGTATVGAAESLPPDTEARMGDFADLVATAIANAATRAELVASRARIVAAADDARRRLERDLHDGAQQRLVALGLGLRAAEGGVPEQLQPLKEQLAGLVATVAAVSAEMQEISRGIHPAILSRGGLGPALKTLARRCTVPVDLDLHVEQRFADSVEVGAYYVVAEALTNAAKHARASVVEVCGHATGGTLHLEIRDDGIGGATAGKGSGLTGLVDRVEALGGKMTVQSPAGSGTSLLVDIPLDTA